MVTKTQAIRMIFVIAALAFMVASPSTNRAQDFDRSMEAARYFEEYQAKQRRHDLILKGGLIGLLIAGGIVLAAKTKKKS